MTLLPVNTVAEWWLLLLLHSSNKRLKTPKFVVYENQSLLLVFLVYFTKIWPINYLKQYNLNWLFVLHDRTVFIAQFHLVSLQKFLSAYLQFLWSDVDASCQIQYTDNYNFGFGIRSKIFLHATRSCFCLRPQHLNWRERTTAEEHGTTYIIFFESLNLAYVYITHKPNSTGFLTHKNSETKITGTSKQCTDVIDEYQNVCHSFSLLHVFVWFVCWC